MEPVEISIHAFAFPYAFWDGVSWSPDGQRIAFTQTDEEGIELWVAEVNTGQAMPLTKAQLNGASGRPFYWLSDNRTLLCKVISTRRGLAPEAPTVPRAPVIRENIGVKAPARTYQDLLKNPYDEALFAYYFTSQILRVTLNGESIHIGASGIITRAEPAPNGKYLLVEILHRPFSYLVPAYRFPKRVEIWDLDGNVIREIADLPLAEAIPIGRDAARIGPRSFRWRADAEATLYWTVGQDGGDPRIDAEVRDRVYTLSAPFADDPIPLIALGLRFSNIRWGHEELALVSEWQWKTRKVRTWIIKPDSPEEPPQILLYRSSEDRYNDPGNPLRRPTATGTRILLTTNSGQTLFLVGEGASPEGNRPLL